MEELLLYAIFLLILGVFLIPIFYLTRQYKATKIVDFLYLDLFFFFILISTLFEVVLQFNESLIIFQLRLGIHNIGWLFLLAQTQRTRKEQKLGKAWYFGLFIFIVIEIMIALWKPIVQPDTITFFGFTGYPSDSLIFPNGAGFKLRGDIILSSDYRYLAEFFWIYVSVALIITYSRVELIFESKRTNLARKLWIMAFVLLITYYIPSTFTLYRIHMPLILVIFSLLFIGYLTIRIPESMLLSSYVIQRIANLHELVHSLKKNPHSEQDQLIWYLDQIVLQEI